MRRFIIALSALLSLGLAASGFARDIQDGKLIVKITKEGRYQVGDAVTVDKVGMYGAVGSFYQEGKDKGKPLQGVLLKKAEKATDEQKHMIYVTAKSMGMPFDIDMDGKEQTYTEPEPAPAAAPVANPAAPAEPQADPNKH
jgi:hypothetical protein